MFDAKQDGSYISGMNKLPLAKRVQILSMLCEGSSMRSISRVADVSINTVYALLAAAGPACIQFHDATVRGVASQRVQCDEAWAFCYAKQKNVATAKSAPEGAGDVWTWTAMDADSKLILSWAVAGAMRVTRWRSWMIYEPGSPRVSNSPQTGTGLICKRSKMRSGPTSIMRCS
jgi:hypothetical protein